MLKCSVTVSTGDSLALLEQAGKRRRQSRTEPGQPQGGGRLGRGVEKQQGSRAGRVGQGFQLQCACVGLC